MGETASLQQLIEVRNVANSDVLQPVSRKRQGTKGAGQGKYSHRSRFAAELDPRLELFTAVRACALTAKP